MPAISSLDVERLHQSSLDLLEQTGVAYNTSKVAEVLRPYGIKVEGEDQRARLPRSFVEWALSQAPRNVRLAARLPDNDLVLDGRRPHHTTDSQGTRTLDRKTGQIRQSSLVDLMDALRMADALDMVEIVNVIVAANDIPAHLRTIRHFAAAFQQTGKHIRTSVLHPDQAPFIFELARLACGSDTFRPVFSTVDCTISPLMHDGAMTEACILMAQKAVPIMIYPMPLAGGTSPVSLAGTILMHNTEFLSGLALFQAVRPGTPLIYGGGASQLDMKTGRYGGSADGHGLGPALAQMAHYYNLPVNLNGLSTSSLAIDAQYGHEASTNCILAYLAGADEIFSVGLLGDAQILSLEKMVMDNHLARRVQQALNPISFDTAHLSANLISRVGIGGQFLTQRETRDQTRRDYIPKWPPAGAKLDTLLQRETEDILANHQAPPLPEGAAEKIADLLEDAGRSLKGDDQ